MPWIFWEYGTGALFPRPLFCKKAGQKTFDAKLRFACFCFLFFQEKEVPVPTSSSSPTRARTSSGTWPR